MFTVMQVASGFSLNMLPSLKDEMMLGSRRAEKNKSEIELEINDYLFAKRKDAFKF